MPEPKSKRAKNVLPDLIIPTMAIAFTGYYLTTITEVPWIAQASAITVSVLLLASIVAFVIRTAVRVRRGDERLALETGRMNRVVTARRAALFLLTVGYVIVIDLAGFTLTTAAFVFLGVTVLSSLSRWRSALSVAFACSAVGYIVFIHFSGTRFPRGPVEELLQGWF